MYFKTFKKYMDNKKMINMKHIVYHMSKLVPILTFFVRISVI